MNVIAVISCVQLQNYFFFCSSWSAGGHLASRNTVSSERIMLYEWWQLVMMLWSRKSDYECKLTVYLSKLVSHKIYAMPYFKRLSIKFQRFMAKLFQFFSLSIFFCFSVYTPDFFAASKKKCFFSLNLTEFIYFMMIVFKLIQRLK